MRLTLNSTGTVLTLLALSLQIAVCASGGRWCYRAAPVVEAEADACASGCCSEQNNAQDRFPGAKLMAAALFVTPGESDCCLEQAEGDRARAGDIVVGSKRRRRSEQGAGNGAGEQTFLVHDGFGSAWLETGIRPV